MISQILTCLQHFFYSFSYQKIYIFNVFSYEFISEQKNKTNYHFFVTISYCKVCKNLVTLIWKTKIQKISRLFRIRSLWIHDYFSFFQSEDPKGNISGVVNQPKPTLFFSLRLVHSDRDSNWQDFDSFLHKYDDKKCYDLVFVQRCEMTGIFNDCIKNLRTLLFPNFKCNIHQNSHVGMYLSSLKVGYIEFTRSFLN